MITHVAIRIPNPDYIDSSLEYVKYTMWSLPAPNRHHNIISNYHFSTGLSIPDDNQQGFLDENGTFYNRKQALVHALNNNQVKDVNNIRMNMLFSEDVW